MKRFTQLIFLVLIIGTQSISAQQEKGIVGYNNWLNPWTEFRPNKATYGTPTQIISGNITSDKTLRKRDVYLLVGDGHYWRTQAWSYGKSLGVGARHGRR